MAATGYSDDDNCRGAWLFDDDLTDESGDSNDLSANGTMDYTTTVPSVASAYGTQGKSIHFDGSSEYASRDHSGASAMSADFPGKAASKDDFAFALWVKVDTYGSYESPLCYDDFYASFSMRTNYNGRWEGWIVRVNDTDPSGANPAIDSTTSTDWRHIVFSFDGSAEEATVWISTVSSFGDVANGAAESFTGITNVREGPNDRGFYIGAGYNNGTFYYYDGYVYQPIVFDRTIDATVAENLYDNGIMGPAAGGGITQLVNYYQRRRQFWMGWKQTDSGLYVR